MSGEKSQQANLETILRPGQVVAGKYCVDSLIGKGGMAAVWAGTNQRTGKRVALKVILRSFASTPDAEEMFRHEALAASKVNHPNVVNVFDVVDHEGMTCIVMELLDGEPFGTYLANKGFLSVEETVALLLPAMRGVAAANAQGIVHRDLKPQNIFVCIGPDGKVLTTKVLDFGISVVVEKALDASAATVVTTHGTPAYMSPEHITNAPDIDERADVYGFGVLLFEALTGQLPFVGEPGPALLMRILNEPPPSAAAFRPDLRPEVVKIIERAMAKSPDDRFESLNQFIRVLEDNFLPAMPLPRSLTPMVGVPILDPVSQPRYVGEPAPGGQGADASGPHGASSTKELYTLPAATGVPARVEDRARQDLGQALDDGSEGGPGLPQDARPHPSGFHTVDLAGSTRAKAIGVLASVAVFLAALAAVAWMAMPRHPEVRLPEGMARRPVQPSGPPALPVPPLPGATAQRVATSADPASPVPAPLRAGQAVAPAAHRDRATEVAPAIVTPPGALSSPAAASPAAHPAYPGHLGAGAGPEEMGSDERATRSGKRRGKEMPAPKGLGFSIPAPEPAPVLPAPKLPPPRAGSLSPDDF
ncbi:MAG: protein kinase [Polyangia bacterium]|jgi:serine/threonine-protein kinase